MAHDPRSSGVDPGFSVVFYLFFFLLSGYYSKRVRHQFEENRAVRLLRPRRTDAAHISIGCTPPLRSASKTWTRPDRQTLGAPKHHYSYGLLFWRALPAVFSGFQQNGECGIYAFYNHALSVARWYHPELSASGLCHFFLRSKMLLQYCDAPGVWRQRCPYVVTRVRITPAPVIE